MESAIAVKDIAEVVVSFLQGYRDEWVHIIVHVPSSSITQFGSRCADASRKSLALGHIIF